MSVQCVHLVQSVFCVHCRLRLARRQSLAQQSLHYILEGLSLALLAALGLSRVIPQPGLDHQRILDIAGFPAPCFV